MCIYGAYHNISFCLFLYISICLFIKLPDYLLPFPWIYVYRHALTSHDIIFLFYALLDLILILLHRHCSIFRTISRSQFDVIYWSTLPGLWLAGWPSRGRLRRVGCQVQSSRAPSSNLTFPGTVTATRRPSDWPSVTLKSHKITRKTNTGGRCVWNRRGLGVRLPAGLPRRRHDAATTLRQGVAPAMWRGAAMRLLLQGQHTAVEASQESVFSWQNKHTGFCSNHSKELIDHDYCLRLVLFATSPSL